MAMPTMAPTLMPPSAPSLLLLTVACGRARARHRRCTPTAVSSRNKRCDHMQHTGISRWLAEAAIGGDMAQTLVASSPTVLVGGPSVPAAAVLLATSFAAAGGVLDVATGWPAGVVEFVALSLGLDTASVCAVELSLFPCVVAVMAAGPAGQTHDTTRGQECYQWTGQ